MLKRIFYIGLTLLLVLSTFNFTACAFLDNVDWSWLPSITPDSILEGGSKTTENGFKYYMNSSNETDSVCYLVEIPQEEEVVIPEYIDGYKVVGLGTTVRVIGYSKDFYVENDVTKKLIFSHGIYSSAFMARLSKLETVVYLDFLNMDGNSTDSILIIYNSYSIAENFAIELRCTDKEYDISNFEPTIIEIPKWVKVIEKGVFDGISGVTIRTSYETKPDGWEDGWNGDCQVEWGVSVHWE